MTTLRVFLFWYPFYSGHLFYYTLYIAVFISIVKADPVGNVGMIMSLYDIQPVVLYSNVNEES